MLRELVKAACGLNPASGEGRPETTDHAWKRPYWTHPLRRKIRRDVRDHGDRHVRMSVPAKAVRSRAGMNVVRRMYGTEKMRATRARTRRGGKAGREYHLGSRDSMVWTSESAAEIVDSVAGGFAGGDGVVAHARRTGIRGATCRKT